MKVALFADTYLPQINGVTNTLSKLVRYYEEKGIEYKMFVPKYDTDVPDHNTERFYSIKFLFYPESRITFPNAHRINSILSGFQPDIIHVMNEFNLGIAGMNYGRKHGIPTISTYTTNFSQYTDYYKINLLKEPIWSYMKWFHTQNDLTLCPSTAARELLYSQGIRNTKIFSRGIDSGQFQPEHRSGQLRRDLGIADKLAFLYVGRVSNEKDLDILSSSYHTIHKRFGAKAAMVITGDGPYLEKCRQMFPGDTIFTGFLRGKELAQIYASCDIFVCPSSTETFGNVVLEAMASGIPVIGADAGGVGETIQNGYTGLKFASRNAEDLGKCMAILLEDTKLRAELSKNGREYAVNRSWNKIFDGLMETYRQVIEEKNLIRKIPLAI